MAVFDVSQTAPIHDHPSPFEQRLTRNLDDEAGEHHRAALLAHLAERGIRYVTADPMLREGVNGLYQHADRTVCVRPESVLQVLKTCVGLLVTAFTHGLPGLGKEDGEALAESVAHLGLVSKGYSVPYVAGWLAVDWKSLELGRIQPLAPRISTTIEGARELGVRGPRCVYRLATFACTLHEYGLWVSRHGIVGAEEVMPYPATSRSPRTRR